MRYSFGLTRRTCCDEGGAASVEFALIGILLVITTLGAFELGRVLFTYHRISVAVGAIARLVQMQASGDTIENTIRARFSPSEQGSLAIQVDSAFVANGVTYTRIDVRYDLPLLLPRIRMFAQPIMQLHTLQMISPN